jgi:hypothetical protein
MVASKRGDQHWRVQGVKRPKCSGGSPKELILIGVARDGIGTYEGYEPMRVVAIPRLVLQGGGQTPVGREENAACNKACGCKA